MDIHVTASAGVADSLAPISRQIWDAKYRFKSADGTPIDGAIEDSWRRVARALAETEAEPERWEGPFYEALEDFRFQPAGRILSGAGTDRRVTLFNCFVMGDIADDLGAIFAHLREAALTMQQGGGIGYDFSTLRPKGAPVRGVGADASGPLSFMDVWDAMCRTIMSAGARRGAMMATMRCDHPDIEDFVAAKREPGRLRNFNLSVLVTDPFMAAVERRRRLAAGVRRPGPTGRCGRARCSTRSRAPPTTTPSPACCSSTASTPATTSTIARRSTRPILAPSSRCRPTAPVCWARSTWRGWSGSPSRRRRMSTRRSWPTLVGVAVRMMDNTIDVSGFPLEQQRQEALAKRRIGLGITGLADALMMAGLRYGTPEAAARAGDWAAADQPRRLPRLRPAGGGEGRLSRCSTASRTSPGRPCASWTRTCRR